MIRREHVVTGKGALSRVKMRFIRIQHNSGLAAVFLPHFSVNGWYVFNPIHISKTPAMYLTDVDRKP